MDIIYDLMYDVILPHYVMMAQKNTSPQNISNEKQKQITNAKHKNKESDNQEPTFPAPKKKHNKKDLKKKRSKLQP